MFDFSKYIKESIDKLSLTQGGMAKELGVSRRQVVLWIQGEGTPGDEACYALERLRGLKPQTLVMHKKLNRIEALGLELGKLQDPEILKHHGILPLPAPSDTPKSGKHRPVPRGALGEPAPLTDDEEIAIDYISRGDWTGLVQWGAGKIGTAPPPKKSPAKK